jgi:eukaryotic-like serine/threonine-protein kinase
MHSLSARISTVSVILVTVSVVLALGGVWLSSQRIAAESVNSSLATSQAIQRYVQESRARELTLTSDLLAADPHDTAYLIEAIRGQLGEDDGPDLRSIRDLIDQRRREMDFDFSMLLDSAGTVLTRTDRPDFSGQSLAAHPLVAPVMADLTPEYGIWREGNRLFNVAVVPVTTAFEIVGYLVTGILISDEVAAGIKRVTGVDVVFVSVGEQLNLVASTLDMPRSNIVLERLRESELSQARLLQGEVIPRLDLQFDGESWVARAEPLRDGHGQVLAAALTVDSLDARLAGQRTLQASLLVAGLAAIGLALLLSRLTARRIAQPVTRLASIADKAAQGDYEQRIETQGRDEIATLARAISRLLADLREQQEIAAYVSDLDRKPLPESSGQAETLVDGNSVTAVMGEHRRPDTALSPGHVVGGRYEILQRLGAGAMGTVFKTRDRELDDVVALKVLHPDIGRDSEQIERMRQEIRLARRITHPNVLRTHDLTELDGIPVISMEYVRGAPLSMLLARSGRIKMAAGLRVCSQVLQGLQAAHRAGVLHRDIKPGNIIIDQSGNARLMDFGIAQSANSDAPSLTRPGTVAGTANYLAPELIMGGTADVRSDIYAVGVMMCEIFSGQLPFQGKTAIQVCMAHVHGDPRKPSVGWPEIPGELEQIILKCLAREPEQRYSDVEGLLKAIQGFRRQSVAATGDH